MTTFGPEWVVVEEIPQPDQLWRLEDGQWQATRERESFSPTRHRLNSPATIGVPVTCYEESLHAAGDSLLCPRSGENADQLIEIDLEDLSPSKKAEGVLAVSGPPERLATLQTNGSLLVDGRPLGIVRLPRAIHSMDMSSSSDGSSVYVVISPARSGNSPALGAPSYTAISSAGVAQHERRPQSIEFNYSKVEAATDGALGLSGNINAPFWFDEVGIENLGYGFAGRETHLGRDQQGLWVALGTLTCRPTKSDDDDDEVPVWSCDQVDLPCSSCVGEPVASWPVDGGWVWFGTRTRLGLESEEGCECIDFTNRADYAWGTSDSIIVLSRTEADASFCDECRAQMQPSQCTSRVHALELKRSACIPRRVDEP